MRWPWRRLEQPMETSHVDPIPDGDRVLADGVPHWSGLLHPQAEAIESRTQLLPTLTAPLFTRAARHRSRQARS